MNDLGRECRLIQTADESASMAGELSELRRAYDAQSTEYEELIRTHQEARDLLDDYRAKFNAAKEAVDGGGGFDDLADYIRALRDENAMLNAENNYMNSQLDQHQKGKEKSEKLIDSLKRAETTRQWECVRRLLWRVEVLEDDLEKAVSKLRSRSANPERRRVERRRKSVSTHRSAATSVASTALDSACEPLSAPLLADLRRKTKRVSFRDRAAPLNDALSVSAFSDASYLTDNAFVIVDETDVPHRKRKRERADDIAQMLDVESFEAKCSIDDSSTPATLVGGVEDELKSLCARQNEMLIETRARIAALEVENRQLSELNIQLTMENDRCNAQYTTIMLTLQEAYQQLDEATDKLKRNNTPTVQNTRRNNYNTGWNIYNSGWHSNDMARGGVGGSSTQAPFVDNGTQIWQSNGSRPAILTWHPNAVQPAGSQILRTNGYELAANIVRQTNPQNVVNNHFFHTTFPLAAMQAFEREFALATSRDNSASLHADLTAIGVPTPNNNNDQSTSREPGALSDDTPTKDANKRDDEEDGGSNNSSASTTSPQKDAPPPALKGLKTTQNNPIRRKSERLRKKKRNSDLLAVKMHELKLCSPNGDVTPPDECGENKDPEDVDAPSTSSSWSSIERDSGCKELANAGEEESEGDESGNESVYTESVEGAGSGQLSPCPSSYSIISSIGH